MALPIVETPAPVRKLLRDYNSCFTKPQRKHFSNLVTGLIVSDNKTIQEINDCSHRCDQSSLNRFLTKSNWDTKKINDRRLKQIKKRCKLRRGILICDPTMLHKSGKKMEKANYHYSGITKKTEWGHFLVNSFFSDGNNSFPINASIYIREKDADEEHPFRTSREICWEHIDYALKQKLPIWLVMFDAGLYADFLINDIKAKALKYIAGVRVTNKISVDREERISIGNYLSTLTDSDFRCYHVNGEEYFLHVKEVHTRSIGKEKLLVSYKAGDEKTKKIYTTNIMDRGNAELMHLLLRRWTVEGLHRDSKQHLGLEDYQVRKFGAIQKVVCVVLVAYTQIVLSAKQEILKPFNRILSTIGEGCRFLRLIALRGWRWLKKKAKNISKLREIMNNFVFVKNAKV